MRRMKFRLRTCLRLQARLAGARSRGSPLSGRKCVLRDISATSEMISIQCGKLRRQIKCCGEVVAAGGKGGKGGEAVRVVVGSYCLPLCLPWLKVSDDELIRINFLWGSATGNRQSGSGTIHRRRLAASV